MGKKRPRRSANSRRGQLPADQRPAAERSAVPPSATGRNAFLDALRGLAIVLMVIDHVTGIWFGLGIAETPVRFATRLSMPLFCVLMGYFFKPEARFRFERLGQIAIACIAANLVFYPHYGRIEILALLLFTYLLFIATGRFFPIFVFTIFLFPLDGSTVILDFPITIVISFVAQGMVLRRYGIVAAMAIGTLLASGAVWINMLEPDRINYLLCLFILPATLLVYLGEGWPERRLPGLSELGRYPLTAYVTQYYLIMAVYYFFLR